ncbi:MFS transporter [Castellaniella sp.]|uniref:MFS transporter n=1 Tax=Castellaniella sp. TaxID=1955812 RepID=UPI003C78E75D
MQRRVKTHHLILMVMCLLYFIAYIDRVNISVAAPLIRDEMGLSNLELGLVFSAFAYPYAAMQIFGGWLADRFGPRKVLIVLSLIWGAATLLTGFVGSVIALLVMRFALGIGEGGAFPTATRAFTYWMPITQRGFAQGITHSFSRLGGAITPPLVVLIIALAGWRESFIVLGAVSLAWTVLFLFVFRDTPAEHPRVTPAELAEINAGRVEQPKKEKGPTPWGRLIRGMWKVTFVDFCYGWSLWVYLTWLPSYLKDERGFDLKAMALFTALPLMAGVVGDTLGGIVSDTLLKKTGNIRFARVSVLTFGLVGALLCMVPMVSMEDPLMAVLLLSLSFFCLELTNAVLWSLPIDIAGDYAGTAAGMMNTGFGVAGMISPVAFGFLIQSTGSYHLPFLISAGLLGVGALTALLIDPRKTVKRAPDTQSEGYRAKELQINASPGLK